MLVETEADVDALEVEDPEPDRLPHADHAVGRRDRARSSPACARGSPAITGPRTDDICYATTNRQLAVKQMAEQCDLVLVIGSQELVELATGSSTSRATAAPTSHLIDNELEVREEWLDGARVVGISSGASAPEELVQRLVDFFRARGTSDVAEFEVLREDVRFMLPKTIRQAGVGAAEGAASSPARRAARRRARRAAAAAGGSRGRSPSSRSGGAGSG